jgi:hypothetical protein
VNRERDVWSHAARSAGLGAEELELLADACERGEGLEPQMTFLLSGLGADLSGAFLRSFVDRLDPDSLEAGEEVLGPALEDAVRQTPRPTSGEAES